MRTEEEQFTLELGEFLDSKIEPLRYYKGQMKNPNVHIHNMGDETVDYLTNLHTGKTPCILRVDGDKLHHHFYLSGAEQFSWYNLWMKRVYLPVKHWYIKLSWRLGLWRIGL